MFWNDFLAWGERPAIVTGERAISYIQFAQMCDQFSATLPKKKSLVLVDADNSVESIVALYGTLRSDHVVILCDHCNQLLQQNLIDTYSPEYWYKKQSSSWELIENHKNRNYELNKNLTLMFSTSGSTGNSKCVRLSRDNIKSNTKSIVKYLGINHTENTALILPLHYCYGLSILNTHLSVGASVHLCDVSVEKTGFVEYLKEYQITSFSGVPHTFELLERIKFRNNHLPDLRYIAQAGGSLREPLVTSYAEWVKTNTKKFYVMYGQTEATARIAYMPPEALEKNPHCIGIAIPGGKLSILDEAGNNTEKVDSPGELIYQGPNVMMGYANAALDLAKGCELSQLKTGDLACINKQGLFYIVGRLKRFSKIYGKRYNLDDIEKNIHQYDCTAVCTSDDETLVIGSENKNIKYIVDSVSKKYGISSIHIETLFFSSIPRLTSGKVDYQKILQTFFFQKNEQTLQTIKTREIDEIIYLLTGVYTKAFTGKDIQNDDCFFDLGGDSLTYVSVSIEIENIIGELPQGWEKKSIRQLSEIPKGSSLTTTATASIEAGILARVYAILAIVTGHTGLKEVVGGAALLVLLAGINFSRFHLKNLLIGKPFNLYLSVLKNILIPYWGVLLVYNIYHQGLAADFSELLLVRSFMPEPGRHFFYTWFIQALIHSIVLASIPLAAPRIRNWAKNNLLSYAIILFVFSTLFRVCDGAFGLGLNPNVNDQRTLWVFWLFCLGILISLARNQQEKIIATMLVVVWPMLFFNGDYSRIFAISVGAFFVIWIEKIEVPKLLIPIIKAIGSASIFIYLIHLAGIVPFLPSANDFTTALIRVVAGILQGIIFWKLYKYFEVIAVTFLQKKVSVAESQNIDI